MIDIRVSLASFNLTQDTGDSRESRKIVDPNVHPSISDILMCYFFVISSHQLPVIFTLWLTSNSLHRWNWP